MKDQVNGRYRKFVIQAPSDFFHWRGRQTQTGGREEKKAKRSPTCTRPAPPRLLAFSWTKKRVAVVLCPG